MSDRVFTKENLIHFRPEHDFFVGVDSDGCVFDTMEIKQKECFHALIAEAWGLQSIEPLVRETAEFVNLYSRSRGSNRFPALLQVIDLLRSRPEVIASGVEIPRLDGFRQWLMEETQLGMPALEAQVTETANPDLATVLSWSHAVNRRIEEVVTQVPPFEGVRECLAKLTRQADLVVVSQTPVEALVREWELNGIIDQAAVIAGQELGTKSEHIDMATRGRYTGDHILMIGDAPGDCAAAKANHALFYPINPGHEAASWKRLYDEAFDRFIAGTYAGQYEAGLIRAFDRLLPVEPPWQEATAEQASRRTTK
ncbi:MAG: HAD hydrolase-like protein [Lentisphaerae bacterium]|nr:HAD hydrolase-like protein [Lentisphaerota bacterium]